MYQKDYILRQIQTLIQVIAYVMGLKKDGQFAEARDEIHRALQSVWDVHMNDLLSLPAAELRNLCTIDGKIHMELALAMADLLTHDGEMMEEEKAPEEALARYKQAMVLTELMTKNGSTAPIDIYDRILNLQAAIERNGDNDV